jgi:hypothetical protein
MSQASLLNDLFMKMTTTDNIDTTVDNATYRLKYYYLYPVLRTRNLAHRHYNFIAHRKIRNIFFSNYL